MNSTHLTNLKKIVAECRQMLQHDLCETVEDICAALGDETEALAAKATDPGRRKDFLRLNLFLQSDWARVAPVFREALARAMATAQTFGAEGPDGEGVANLALLSDDELAVQLALRDAVQGIADACAEETHALHRRVAELAVQHVLPQGDNPFRVSAIFAHIELASAQTIPDVATRVTFLQLVGQHLASELPQLMRAINQLMLDGGILPELNRKYRNNTPASAQAAAVEAARITNALEKLTKARSPEGRVTPAPPASDGVFFKSLKTLQATPAAAQPVAPDGTHTNVVRMARESAAARSVHAVESVTLDIVSSLFDHIFSDNKVSDAVKSLVSRLQIPVLKVAMLNQQFFADRSHPTRRFIDALSGVAIRWGKSVDVNDPFFCKLSELVEQIQATYDDDPSIFEAAIGDLGSFITDREAKEAEASRVLAEAVRAREEEMSAQREAQAQAQLVADQALTPLLKPGIPEVIEDFLRSYWRDVLQGRIFAAGGDGTQSAAAAEALRVVPDLIWSVTPKTDIDARKRHVALLPVLLRAINAGLNEIGISSEERRGFMDALVALHLAALRGEMLGQRKPDAEAPKATRNAPKPVPRPAGPGPTLQISHATESGVRVQDISLPTNIGLAEVGPDRTSVRHVRQLVRGDWVDFITGGQTRRERLTWINPSRTLFLFSNHASECAISITPDALALRLTLQTARVVKREAPMFERALDSAVRALESEAA